MSTCCVCLKQFEGENAPILMFDGEGEACVLCPDCGAIVDKIAGTPDSPERDAAIAALREIDVESPMIADELVRLVRREDAPLGEEDAYEAEEEVEELPEAAPVAVSDRYSNLSLYLALGCLGAAFILFILLRYVL